MNDEIIYFLRYFPNNHLAIGTNKGFVVASLNSKGIDKVLLDRRKIINHGIRLVIPVFNGAELSDRVGLVGGGDKPLSNGNFVCWNDKRIPNVESDISTKTAKISNVFISNGKLFLILSENIFIFTFPQMERCSAKICFNGVADIKSSNDKEVIAFRTNQDKIQIKINNRIDNLKENETIDKMKISFIRINQEMTKMATVCDKGIDVTVWQLSFPLDHKKALHFYRGQKEAQVYSLYFNKDSSLLLLGTSSGTIHIFDLINSQNNKTFPMKSVLGYIPFVSNQLPINQVWSSIAIETKLDTKFESFFVDDEIFVFACNGTFMKFTFDVFAHAYQQIEVSQKRFLDQLKNN